MYSSTYLVPSVSLAAFRKQQSHLTTRESEDFVRLFIFDKWIHTLGPFFLS